MIKIINRLLGTFWFPISLRLLALGAFIGLVIIGFSSPTNNPVFVNQLSNTNLTTSFVWRLWWPMIVLSAIFFGRVWCMICPVEMVTTFFARIGLKLKRPEWLLSGWGITGFYFIVLAVGVTIFQIDANPGYTSYYLLFIVCISILTGLIFEKNTFCRYICPVGYLLGIFSKMSIWGWRVKNKSVCDSCRDKSCIKKKYRYNLNYKSCGVDLIPADIKDNNYCLLCGGCLKNCKIHKSIDDTLRPNPGFVKIGFASDLMQLNPIRVVEWAFLFFLTGSMIFEMTHFHMISSINNSSGAGDLSGILNLSEDLKNRVIDVLYLYFLLPAILWIIPYFLIRISGIQMSVRNYLKDFSLAFLPVIVAFFVGLVIMEVVTKIPYYKFIVRDIKGVETIKMILFRQIEIPALPSWTDWMFDIILIIAIITGFFLSFRVVKKLVGKLGIKNNIKILYVIPVVFFILFFLEAIVYQLL